MLIAWPGFEQVQNLWNTLRKQQYRKGFASCDDFRRHPDYQLPLTLRELGSKFDDGAVFSTGHAPQGERRWGVGIVSKAMVERLGKVRYLIDMVFWF